MREAISSCANTLELASSSCPRVTAAQDVARFYGTHAWHWYATQGLPVVGGVLVPLALAAAWQGRGDARVRAVAGLGGWMCLALSASPHKEHRFLRIHRSHLINPADAELSD